MKMKPIHTIEISAGSVKMASFLKGKKNQPILQSFLIESFDSKPKMEETVRRVAQTISEKTAVYATSVWAATMMARKVVMKIDPSEDVKKTLNLEAEKYVPFPINECLVDGYVIRELEDGNQSDVMFIASKKDLILERCEFLKKAGIRLNGMDAHPVAIANLYAHLNSNTIAKATALVHLGDTPGTVMGEENFASVCFDGKPAVIRDLGAKLSEANVGDPQWRYVVTQVANAVSFFENSMKAKVELFQVSGDSRTCAEFIKRYKEHAEAAFSRWSALEALEYDNTELKSLATQHEAALTILFSIACRKLFT